MTFDIQGARAAGYSDDEIADHLATQRGIDVGAARQAGWSTPDLMAELSSEWAKRDLPKGVKAGAGGRSGADPRRTDAPGGGLASADGGGSTARRWLGDTGLSLLKGAIAVPEAAVGLADMVTGGRVGKFLENEGGDIGFRPAQARKMLDEAMSPEQQAANQRVQQAANPDDPFLQRAADIGQAALQNPSTIGHAVLESLPSIGAGGVLARGAMAAAPRLAPVVAGAIGEGTVAAGSTAAQVRQDSPDKLLTGKQAAVAGGSGALTGVLGLLGGKVAQRMGIGDVDTLLAGGGTAAQQKGFVRRVLEGAASEGVLEELPQSVQEQVAQNYATGKALDEGVDHAAVMGLLTGGAMGAAANAKPSAWQAARSAGFNVDPPVATDPPLQQRAKMVDAFANAAAMGGMPKDAADAVLAQAERLPLAQMGPFLAAATQELTQRGLGAEVPAEVLQALASGPMAADVMADAPGDKQRKARPAQTDAAPPAPAAQPDAPPAAAPDALVDPGQDIADNIGRILADAGALPAAPQQGGKVSTAQQPQQPEPIPVGEATESDFGAYPGPDLQPAEAIPTGDMTELQPEVIQADDLLSAPGRRPAGPAPIEGERINRDWSRFTPESGTRGIPREQMPQIQAGDRSAFLQFARARGVEASTEEVDPASLKPTQAEFSPRKVRQAAGRSSDRAILVSQDGHIVDGTHQWAAAREAGTPVKVTRLKAPIDDVLRIAHQFPSSTTAKGAAKVLPQSQEAADAAVQPDNQPDPASVPGDAQPAASGGVPAGVKPAAGDTFQMDGQQWRVRFAGQNAATIEGADGTKRAVSTAGATWGRMVDAIAQARPAPAAAPAPVQPATTTPQRVEIPAENVQAEPAAPAPAGPAADDRFQPVTAFTRVSVGPVGAIKPRPVASGKPLFRETNLDGLDGMLSDEQQPRFHRMFVTDNPDLAIGQGGNKGVRVTFRPDALSGREHIKPGTGDIAGREYETDVVAPRAIQSITMPAADAKKLRGLTKRFLAQDFDRVDQADGTVVFNRKGLASAASAAQDATAPTAPAAPVTWAKRTEAGGKARHPKTVMGSRVLALVSRELGGLNDLLMGDVSSRVDTRRIDKRTGKPVTQMRNPLIPGVGRLFRSGGTSDLQHIAELLEENDYLPPGSVANDIQAARMKAVELLQQAMNKDEPLTWTEQLQAQQEAAEAEALADRAEQDAQAQAEFDAERAAIQGEYGWTDADAAALDDGDIPWDQPGQTGAAAMRAMGFTDQEIANEYPEEATSGPASRSPEEVGQDDAQGADDPAGSRGQAPRDQAPAPAGAGSQGDAQGLTQGPTQAQAPDREIGRLGTTPKAATAVTLKANPDGTATPWHEGYALLDFESGEPITVPAGATPAQAVQAIKDGGALGRHQKFYGVAADPAPAERPAMDPLRVDGFVEAAQAPATPAAPEVAQAEPDAPTADVGGHPLIEHTTAKGKVLEGYILGIDKDKAFQIDKFTFRKDGGYFIRKARADELPASEFAALPGPSAKPDPIAETQPNDAVAAPAAEPKRPKTDSMRETAQKLIDDAREAQGRDRNTNTARRARMASSAEADARKREAIGQTMLNIADAIDRGEAPALAGITTKAHVETLDSALTLAIHEADRQLSYVEQQRQKGRAAEPKDIALARLPRVSWNSGGANEQAMRDAIKGKKGAREVERLLRIPPSAELLAAARKIGVTPKEIDRALGWWNLEVIARLQRLARAGIKTDDDLRKALTEYAALKDGAKTEDPIKAAERRLIGQKVGIDFFPTPASMAQRMVQMADIGPGDRVLEPSGGNGNIADAAKAAGASVDVVEISTQLRELLQAKGYPLVGSDFTNFEPTEKYDAVLMNPPFSNRQDAEHIRRAYGMLKPGGRLVAIAGEGVFFGSDAKAKDFRDWLDSVGAEVEQLPAGTFKDAKLLAQTGANARLLTIIAPSASVASEPGAQYGAQQQETPYETDLFGNAVPEAPRASARRPQRQAARADGNVDATGDVPAPAGTYASRTRLVTTRQQQLGHAGPVRSLKDAANALAYLRTSAVERLDALVTDASGKPLAIVGGFKGALSQTSVYPATVMGEAIRIPGAANIWMVHNHPSGGPDLSRADRQLADDMRRTFEGTSMQVRGIVAVGSGGRFQGDSADVLEQQGSRVEQGTVQPKEGASVPAVERQITENERLSGAISSPDEAKREVRSLLKAAGGQSHVILMDAQHQILATIPWPGQTARPLRNNGRLDALYRAVSEANAGAAIIAQGPDMSGRQADNLAGALNALDVRVLDSIDATGRSAAEKGDLNSSTAFMSRSRDAGTLLDDAGQPLVVYRGEPGGAKAREVSQAQPSYFTDSQATAEGYTARRGIWRGPRDGMVSKANLSMRDPLVIDAAGKRNDNIPVPWQEWKPKTFGNLPANAVSVEDAARWAAEHGHDGLIVRNVVDTADPTERAKPSTVFAVFSSGQIAGTAADPAMSRSPQTETKAFRDWFGDSKVVDAEGNPLVVYHGTADDIAAFKIGPAKKVGHGKQMPGIYFSPLASTASGYARSSANAKDASTDISGANVVAAYVAIRNPAEFTDPEAFAKANRAKLEASGHDGAFRRNAQGDVVEIVAFRPEQIKSALGNSGAFDPANPDIRASRGRQRGSVSTGDARAIVDQIRAALPNAPQIVLHESVGQAPRELEAWIRQQNAAEDVEAVYWQGQVHAFPGNVESVERMQFVLAHHELRHHGLAALLGTGKDATMMRIYRSNKKVRDRADDAIKRGQEDSIVRATEEALADIDPAEVAKLNGARSLIAALRDGLRRVAAALRQAFPRIAGAINPDTWTDDDVLSLVRRAEDVSRDGPPLVGAGRAMFSRRPPAAENDAGWTMPEGSRFDDFAYKWQDKQIDLKRAVRAVRDEAGTLQDQWDAYLQEELFHGRAAKRTQDFVGKELDPLLKDMAARGVSMEELEQFLHARHAKEANEVIAERNRLPDDGQMGLDGKPIESPLQDGGSGMLTKEAQDYLDGLAPDQRLRLDALAARVDAIIAKTRQTYVDYGLESQATVDGWAAMFQHYVPLQREDKDGGGMGIGQGFSIKGRETRHRTGSTAKVVDILANIAAQREKAIVRGEKNRVALSVVGLAKLHPNPDIWTVDKIPTERVLNEATGLVVERPQPMFKMQPNVLVAKVMDKAGNVHERAVVFNPKNERALRMSQALKNLDAAQLEGVLGVTAKITRYFAAINTQYNPIFGGVNLVRDVQGAAINLTSTPLANKRAAVVAAIPSALRAIYRTERGKAVRNAELAALWDEVQLEGGVTGFRDQFRTSAERAEAIRDALDPTNWTSGKYGRIFTAGGALKLPMVLGQKMATPLFRWLTDYNQAMEGATRLAAYKVAREQGLSKQQAASIAKNLTVNFNRKGQAGMQAGALYAFFNASVQGTARMGEVLVDTKAGHGFKLQPAAFKIMAGGMLLGAMQAVLLAAAGFDDDEPPEFVRERNMILPIGEKRYLTLPMPLGWHVLPNIGRISTEFVLGGFKNPGDQVLRLAQIVADSFNPMGSSTSLAQFLSPTVTDPIVALSENKDWTGKPIAKQTFDRTKPGFENAKDVATAPARMIAEAINWMSGGSPYVAGALSPTPDQIDYLFGQVTGGVGREANKALATATAMATGEDLPPYKVPLLGRFYGDGKAGASEAGRFYENLNRMAEHEATVKGLGKDMKEANEQEAAALAEQLDTYRAAHPEADLIDLANRKEREVRKLRTEKRKALAERQDRAAVKQIDQDIAAAMRELNEAMAEAMPPASAKKAVRALGAAIGLRTAEPATAP